jgi:hypothetical protein
VIGIYEQPGLAETEAQESSAALALGLGALRFIHKDIGV